MTNTNNTNTVKALLVAFTGKRLVTTDEATYNTISGRAPAISQDVMHTDVGPAIVTRAYGSGEECYKVDFEGQPNKFFKL